MTARDSRPKFVEAAVDRHFRRPNAGRAARKQVFTLAGTALVVLAALGATGWLSWLLWIWAAHRAVLFTLLATLGPTVADALNERLDGLPSIWRGYLDGTAPSAAEAEMRARR